MTTCTILSLFLLCLSTYSNPEAKGIPLEEQDLEREPALKVVPEVIVPEANPTKKPLLPAKQLENIRLQIYLDQKMFGPGVLDGKMGTYTKMAIEAYNMKMGRELSDWETVKSDAVKEVTNAFAMAIVPSVAKNYINSELPTDNKREAQAKEKQMSYRTMTEFMAERYHTTEDILITLNGNSKMKSIDVRSAIRVPNVEPFLIENLANGRSFKSDVDLSRRWVVIDTKKLQLRIFEARFEILTPEPDGTVPKAMIVDENYKPWDESKAKMIAAFPITPGKPQFTHYGEWKIKNAIEFPTWRYDKSLLETGIRSKNGLNIPAGPNNPVGVLWLGLNKSGIGIHGTNSPRTIGRAHSSGCIRMANWDIVHIPTLVRPGAVVIIK